MPRLNPVQEQTVAIIGEQAMVGIAGGIDSLDANKNDENITVFHTSIDAANTTASSHSSCLSAAPSCSSTAHKKARKRRVLIFRSCKEDRRPWQQPQYSDQKTKEMKRIMKTEYMSSEEEAEDVGEMHTQRCLALPWESI